MTNFLMAVRKSIATENWYGALMSALVLPDICSRLEDPTAYTNVRYPKWCDRFLSPRYTRNLPIGAHVFLSGGDCYALRCSLLHEGGSDIVHQKARTNLVGFAFVAPKPPHVVHLNQRDKLLQLQVDIFSEDVCAAVEDWTHEVMDKNADIRQRADGLVTILSLPSILRF